LKSKAYFIKFKKNSNLISKDLFDLPKPDKLNYKKNLKIKYPLLIPSFHPLNHSKLYNPITSFITNPNKPHPRCLKEDHSILNCTFLEYLRKICAKLQNLSELLEPKAKYILELKTFESKNGILSI
jgi:hypothetical protein